MAINFLPGNFIGETLTEGGKTWTWDGQKWNLSGSSVNGNFVLRTGDVMTGDLIMDDADIELDNGKIEFEAKGDTAYVQNSDNRFARIVSRAPKNTSDGTTDYTTVFGIKVDLDEGNTFKNQFAVNNRDGDIVKVTSGTGPTVQFGTNFADNKTGWDDPKYEGSVKIEGIPTPAFDNPEPTIAVNKEYVDKRDEVLQQEIIELEEEIDAIAPSTQRGEWHFDKDKSVPDPGDYYLLKGASGLNPEATDLYNEADGVVFHNTDANGVINTWSNVEVDELIQIFDKPDPDFVLGTITNVDTTKISNAVWIEFDRISSEGSPNNNPDIKLSRINIFEAPSGGGDVSGFVLKAGDTMTGDLVIDRSTGSSNVETKLTLTGERSNTTNPAAAIKFENKNSTTVGYLTYKSYGSDSWFTFTQDVDLNSKGIHGAARLRLNSGGHIASGVNERIIVRTASSGDNTAGTEIRRPGDNKRTFSIRGKVKGSNTLQDIFWAYGNSGTTGDAINYTGLITANTHIATKGYVDGKVGTTIVYRNGAYYIST